MTSSTTHGEPNAWKHARPVRREACRNLFPKGSKALHAYSTRWLVARRYDSSDRRGKRGPVPTKANMIRKLVLEMAEANPSWGYGHIHGELKGLDYDVSWQTVRRVMLNHGLLPDPDRPHKTTWNTFIKSHWDSICACDFFSCATC